MKNTPRTQKKERPKNQNNWKKGKRCVQLLKTWKKWFKDPWPKDHND